MKSSYLFSSVRRRIGWSFIVGLCWLSVADADTVVLKSGETIEGSIRSQTATNVTVQVSQYGGTVFSTRVIPMSDVQDLQRMTPEQQADAEEERAFAQISRYGASSVSYTIDEYNRGRDALQQFLATYPQSVHCSAVTNLLQQWTEERTRVAAGELKWKSVWFSGAAASQVALQFQAAQLIAEGDRYAARGQYELALKQFEEALSHQPLLAETVASAEQKINGALRAWKTSAATTGTGTAGSAILELEQNTRELKTRAASVQRQIDEVKGRQQMIATARKGYGRFVNGRWQFVSWQKFDGANVHWFAGKTDLGPVLPVPPKLGLLPNTLAKINASITKNTADLAELKARSATTASSGAQIKAIADRCSRKVASAQGRAITETALLAMRGDVPRTTAAAAVETTAPVTEAAASEPADTPAPPTSPWWKRYWYLWGVVGVALFLGFRRR